MYTICEFLCNPKIYQCARCLLPRWCALYNCDGSAFLFYILWSSRFYGESCSYDRSRLGLRALCVWNVFFWDEYTVRYIFAKRWALWWPTLYRVSKWSLLIQRFIQRKQKNYVHFASNARVYPFGRRRFVTWVDEYAAYLLPRTTRCCRDEWVSSA